MSRGEVTYTLSHKKLKEKINIYTDIEDTEGD